jgi:hypothetical protein
MKLDTISLIQKPHCLVKNPHSITYIHTFIPGGKTEKQNKKEKKRKEKTKPKEIKNKNKKKQVKVKQTKIQTANHKKRRIEKKKKKVQSRVVGITNKLNNGV